MSKTATTRSLPADQPAEHDYEQPLTERMRTFMRLEFLYQQLLYNADQEADWATRAATSTLLDIVTILNRGDVRSDVLKELDGRIDGLRRFQSQPEVDTARLNSLVSNLEASKLALREVGNHYLQPLKDNEFLSAIKHRSSIPGGTCEFDLPEYSHWLRQPYSARHQVFMSWAERVRPVCDAVTELLWLIREISPTYEKRAINGMYQHSMPKNTACQLLRVLLPAGSALFPEISGSHQRFTVRFLEWSTTERRAVQTGHDIEFRLSIC
ncbi:MAG: cell division protein ZapD [Woeseiaceae bacterium]|nr:cell division protein ZapD [Woeseiaceae bacterium]